MTAYIAVCGSCARWGSLVECIEWANAQKGTAKVLRARAGEPSALVIGEVTTDGWQSIPKGRAVPLSKLRRHA
jgi:hypothetical protein